MSAKLPTLQSLTIGQMAMVFFSGGAFLVLTLIAQRIIYNRKYKFPPSPPGGIPLLGHGHLLPNNGFPGDKTKEMADQLGTEMMHMQLGGVNWVFLNSSRVVEDLLEKRSAIYSGRPKTVVGELVSHDYRLVLTDYGPQWRDNRKATSSMLTAKMADRFRPMADIESRQCLYELVQSPDKWYQHFIRLTASFLVNMVYGTREQETPERFHKLSDAQDIFLRNLAPGVWLVDAFPQLWKLPKVLQWWRPAGEKLFKYTRDAYCAYYDLMMTNIKNGTQRECFSTALYRDTHKSKWLNDFDQKLFICGGLIEAGSDSTKNQLNLLVAAMATNPEWVKTARKELDAVCGGNAERLPAFTDWEALPYIQAIQKETMRWRPNVSPIGFPHMLTQDDEYEGYVLPAGTVVTINNWALSLSEKEYEDAHSFKPDRFLNDDLWKPLSGHYGYGAGRRGCAGFRVAQNSMFLNFSRFIYCFDVEEDPADPIDTYHIAMTPAPGKANDAPFTAKIKVRSEAHRQLILRECKGHYSESEIPDCS